MSATYTATLAPCPGCAPLDPPQPTVPEVGKRYEVTYRCKVEAVNSNWVYIAADGSSDAAAISKAEAEAATWVEIEPEPIPSEWYRASDGMLWQYDPGRPRWGQSWHSIAGGHWTREHLGPLTHVRIVEVEP